MKLKLHINRAVAFTAMALLSSVFSSCMTNDTGGATMTGAAVGGTAGGLLAKKHGYSTAEGITAGTLLGGAFGHTIGETAAGRRKVFTSQQDALNNDINHYSKEAKRRR